MYVATPTIILHGQTVIHLSQLVKFFWYEKLSSFLQLMHRAAPATTEQAERPSEQLTQQSLFSGVQSTGERRTIFFHSFLSLYVHVHSWLFSTNLVSISGRPSILALMKLSYAYLSLQYIVVYAVRIKVAPISKYLFVLLFQLLIVLLQFFKFLLFRYLSEKTPHDKLSLFWEETSTSIWSEWRLTVIAATMRIALVDILDLSEVDIPAGVFLHPAVGWG